MANRIVVDKGLCESNGICESVAPDVFELDADEELQIDAEAAKATARAKLERAVGLCPRGALTLTDE